MDLTALDEGPTPASSRARAGAGEKGKDRQGGRQGEKAQKRLRPAGDGADSISLLSDDDEGHSQGGGRGGSAQTRCSDPRGWECSACTFINAKASAQTCAMCAVSRAESRLWAAAAAQTSQRDQQDNRKGEQKWSCHSCTFKNRGSDAVCAVCDSECPRTNAGSSAKEPGGGKR